LNHNTGILENIIEEERYLEKHILHIHTESQVKKRNGKKQEIKNYITLRRKNVQWE
jgi:hypothetical protein